MKMIGAKNASVRARVCKGSPLVRRRTPNTRYVAPQKKKKTGSEKRMKKRKKKKYEESQRFYRPRISASENLKASNRKVYAEHCVRV